VILYDPVRQKRIYLGLNVPFLWHVDDLKICHIYTKMLYRIILLLEQEFGNEAPLKTIGKLHDYLGMTIDFLQAKKVKIQWKSTSSPLRLKTWLEWPVH